MTRWARCFLGAVGLSALLRIALQIWGTDIPLVSSEYGQYHHILLNRYKLLDLMLHVGGVLLLILFFCIEGFVNRNKKQPIQSKSWQTGWVLFSLFFNVALLFWYPKTPHDSVTWGLFGSLAVIWLFSTFLPYYEVWLKKRMPPIDWKKQWDPKNTQRVYIVLTVLSAGQLFWAMSPLITGPLQLLNEFTDIPSITIFSETDKKVSNKDYFDEHQLLGPMRRYSPDRDRGQTPPIPDAVCFRMAPASGLSTFLVEEANRTGFIYEKQEERLCAVDSVTPEQWLRLRQIAPDPLTQQRLDSWYASLRAVDMTLQERVMSKEEKQFARVNQFALGTQFSGMGVIHHHNFMLAPLNELDLGKPRSEIFAQYGWLNLWFTKGIMDVLGGLNYQTYFKVWYSYYLVYYLLYFVMLWIVFRHLGYVAAGSLLSVGLLCFIDFQWLLQPPGINPIRRIMELPLIAGLFLYWETRRPRYLILAVVSVWLAILNNWQFGIMALGAAGFSCAVFFRLRDHYMTRWEAGMMGMGAIGSLALIFWAQASPDPLSAYYLAGASSVPITQWLQLFCLIVFGLLATLLLQTFDVQRPMTFLCVFILPYTAAVMTYALWNGTATYLLVPGPLYVCLILVFIHQMCSGTAMGKQWAEKVIRLVVLVGVLIFAAGLWNQQKAYNEYLGLMASHQTYEWNFERAKMESDMDPRFFADGISLIQRYSGESSIYIISKYDNFLPFLARKYSAMPYFEIAKFLISSRETQACIEKILMDKPQILFVDTDIRRDFATDVVHRHAPFGGLNAISRYHVEQMRSLQRVFQAVRSDYELVEQGLLISVYQRKK